ncbi:MAG: hypothetical protein HRU31_05155 [Rhodobacteraceae bacterium]|nr:hypothetical protein [Paracoccaceae bacterium]
MKMATGGLGLSFGFGGFNSKLVILFETPQAFDSFIEHGLDATAQGAAQAGDDGRDTMAWFQDGRAVYVLTQDGWRVSANLAGTKYWPDTKLNAF